MYIVPFKFLSFKDFNWLFGRNLSSKISMILVFDCFLMTHEFEQLNWVKTKEHFAVVESVC